MYIVNIEWDGDKPPTVFYTRMREKFGLVVRGDKKQSPLQRRTSWRAQMKAETAVVFQEGSIMCSSESLARSVYIYAREYGAKNIMILDAEAVDFNMTVEDAKILQTLESEFGKKGRPSGPKQNFVITCFEEGASYPVFDSHYALVCPACSGTRTRSRTGDVSNYKLPDDGEIIDAWMRNRFVSGQYEVPDDGETVPPATVVINDKDEERVIGQIRSSDNLMADINRMPRRQGAAFLDAVFCSRSHVSADARREARVKACVILYEKGIASTEISLIENPAKFDLLDASAVAEPEKTAAMWLSLHRKGGQP